MPWTDRDTTYDFFLQVIDEYNMCGYFVNIENIASIELRECTKCLKRYRIDDYVSKKKHMDWCRSNISKRYEPAILDEFSSQLSAAFRQFDLNLRGKKNFWSKVKQTMVASILYYRRYLLAAILMLCIHFIFAINKFQSITIATKRSCFW